MAPLAPFQGRRLTLALDASERMTDDQYIEFIRKKYQKRRLSGSIGLLIVFAMAIWGYFAFSDLSQEATDLTGVEIFLTEGEPVSQVQISGVETLVGLKHSLGVKNGVFFGQLATFLGLFAVFFLAQIFGGRKDRLLLEYYDKSASNQ